MKKLTLRLAVLFTLIVLIIFGTYIWWNDAISAANPLSKNNKIFTVTKGESVRDIATRLKQENLIRNQIAFFLWVKFSNTENKLQAGDFRLSSNMSMEKIAENLTHGTLDVWLTTLEGWRDEEIAMKLSQDFAIPEQEFLKVAREGYMFPDTYLIPKEATAGAVVKIFLDNFDKRVTQEIKDNITMQNLTLEQGIVLASIVEREGRSDEDRPIIAGILLNRLRKDWSLQADATLQYILGYQSQEKSWWKKQLFNEDKKIKSPFNTYLNPGLPPQPICNPGLSAINALANPTTTDYMYYIHDTEGVAHYAVTLVEHEANVAKYLK
jgi:UPF0755 protein